MKRKQLLPQPSFIPIFQDYGIFKEKKVGLTGGSGTLGKILISRLKEHGVSFKNYEYDITDQNSLNIWFSENQFDLFFHLAAIVPVKKVLSDSIYAYEVNAIGSYNISKNIAKLMPSCWLFLASSSHVYKPNALGNNEFLGYRSKLVPNTFYGASKLAGEQIAVPILKHFGLNYCLGRIFSFTGVNQKPPFLVPSLINNILKLPENGVLEVKNANSVRDIIDAETVIDCILYISANLYKGTINIGSGNGVKIIEIAKYLAKSLNKKINIIEANNNEYDSLVADVVDLKKLLKNN